MPLGKHGSAAPPQLQHAKQLSNGRAEVARTGTPPPRLKPQQTQQAKQAQHGTGSKGAATQRTATPPPRTASPSLLEADSSLDAEMDAAVVRKAAAKQPKQTAVPARPRPLGAPLVVELHGLDACWCQQTPDHHARGDKSQQ